MASPDPRSLSPSDRATVQTQARRFLAQFRGDATARVRERARRLVAGAHLTAVSVDRRGAAAVCDDDGEALRVELRWADPGSARCPCADFRRRGTCPHVVALLEATLSALEEAEEPAPQDRAAPRWLTRLERVTHRIEAGGGRRLDPWRAPDPSTLEVRYVLRFGERREGLGARLECQVQRGGPAANWVSIPFSGADAGDVDLSLLGPAHAAVAAVASGASDAGWRKDPTHRAVTVAAVTRDVARPLLGAAAAAGPLLVALEGSAAHEPLNVDLQRDVGIELEAEDESRSLWRVHATLVLDGAERVSAEDVVRVTHDGLCVLRGSGRLLLLPQGEATAIVIELSGGPLELPAEEAPSLSAIAGTATLVGPRLAEIAEPARPVPCLRAEAPLEAEGEARVECEVTFDYSGTRVRPDDRTKVVPGLDGRSVPRQPLFEAAAILRFRDLGGRPAGGGTGAAAAVPGGRFLGMVGTLVDEGWQVTARDQLVRGMGSVTLSVRSGVDWFDLVGGVSFGDEEIPFPVALDAARNERGFVELGDGSRGLLPERWLERWKLAALGEEIEGGLRFDSSQAWAVAALAEQRAAEVDEPFARLREQLGTLGAPEAVDAPAAFRGELRPYQREGLGWMQSLDRVGLSGCLADEMGLGKTVQVLAYLLSRAPGTEGRHSAVVAPRSLVFNWLHEAARFAPTLSTLDFTGPDRWDRLEQARPGSLLVTTYGTLRRDATRLEETELDVLVLDEAHAIRSRRSQTAVAARALRARRRLALSGTPMENHLGDLWSQLEFLNPGMLGAHAAFASLGAPRGRHALPEEGRDLLARALRPFLFRRTKDAVLPDLPPKVEQVLSAPMGDAQRTTYEDLSRYFRTELSKSKGQRRKERLENPGEVEMHVLSALTRLRQAACHPGLVDPSLVAEGSGKLDLLLPMLEELVASGRKAIVFSSFTRLLGLIRTRLETARIPYHVLEGATRNRGSVVERFQTAPDGCVFLISLKAGGAGLNLTAADYVFLMDPWWNPAAEAQAVDRAHRIGRTRPVHVYRILTEGTVEARVVELQDRKSDLARTALEGAATTLSDLGPEDLEFLLT